MKYPISKLKIGSAIPNCVALKHSNAFCIINLDVNALIIVAKINAIDLFNNLGIFLFSCSKNGFSPFFIL